VRRVFGDETLFFSPCSSLFFLLVNTAHLIIQKEMIYYPSGWSFLSDTAHLINAQCSFLSDHFDQKEMIYSPSVWRWKSDFFSCSFFFSLLVTTARFEYFFCMIILWHVGRRVCREQECVVGMGVCDVW